MFLLIHMSFTQFHILKNAYFKPSGLFSAAGPAPHCEPSATQRTTSCWPIPDRLKVLRATSDLWMIVPEIFRQNAFMQVESVHSLLASVVFLCWVQSVHTSAPASTSA